jgi:hypothetical protein
MLPAWLRGAAVPLLAGLAFCLVALALIVTNPYPMPYDELEHVSYAAFLQQSGRLLPKFEIMQTLMRDDVSRWDNRANYLGHPSPYYLYIGRFLFRSLSTAHAILLARLASFVLILAGMALALSAGWRRFAPDQLAGPVFCLLLAFCPKLLAISGQVTNDALAFLGGALAYWGVSTAARRRNIGLVGLAVGLNLACWAKPNAGLAVGLWLGWFSLVKPAPRAIWMLAIAAGGAFGTVPYWFILRDYHALVPITVEQFGHVRQLAGFGEYIPGFLLNVAYSWCYAQMGTWPPPDLAGLVAAGLAWALLACAARGGVLARARPPAERDAMATAALLALACLLPIHFWFSATRLGFSLPAASFRYYLPLWVPLAHAVAEGIRLTRSPQQRGVLASLCLAALVVGWLSP